MNIVKLISESHNTLDLTSSVFQKNGQSKSMSFLLFFIFLLNGLFLYYFTHLLIYMGKFVLLVISSIWLLLLLAVIANCCC